MHIRLLGTAAAEGWPAVFCSCAHCDRARAAGGRSVRTRSSANVDGAWQFDFGPDAYAQALAGNDLRALRHLIFTHSHEDHLNPADLGMRRPPFAHGCDEPLHVWGNDRVIGILAPHFSDPARGGLALHALRPFEAIGVGDATLIPLLADHDRNEACLIHLFGRGGRWLLYGHDTGIPPESTWGYLAAWAAQHHRLDVVLLDCTNGPGSGRENHMGLPAAAEVRERLLQIGAAGPGARFVATHFSHNGGLLHDELVARAAPLGLEVAYDGMEITAG